MRKLDSVTGWIKYISSGKYVINKSLHNLDFHLISIEIFTNFSVQSNVVYLLWTCLILGDSKQSIFSFMSYHSTALETKLNFSFVYRSITVQSIDLNLHVVTNAEYCGLKFRALDREVIDDDQSFVYEKLRNLGRFTGKRFGVCN